MAIGHVILKEFHVDRPSAYFTEYARKYTDMPMLVRLDATDKGYQAGRFLRASDLDKALGQDNNPEWKTVAYDENSDSIVVPNGSVGVPLGENGRWNLEEKEAGGKETKLSLSLLETRDDVALVGFPYFGGKEHELGRFTPNPQDEVIYRKVPVRKVKLAGGEEALVASVFDLITAHYGVDRGLDCENTPKSYDDNKPYTPAWQEQITGVKRDRVIAVAREFAENADKTHGKSMVILGAGLNHWYHMDMNYRGIINMLVFCGCVGQSGGGWAHYVGQEKLRPQTGWQPLAFALDWARPPRHMNSTSFFYAHTDQWRYERLNMADMLSPLANPEDFKGSSIDFNVRAERMGWLPSAPQLAANPLQVARDAAAAGKDVKDYVVDQLKSGRLTMACEDPDNPVNFPRNLFIWRSNLLGSSGKGHEYFLKHLLGTKHGVQGKDLGEEGAEKPMEVVWRDEVTDGKLDLLVTLDFRMSTTCLYSDIVLPTATWYEKNDLNTSDMHPFIHPLSEAVNPCWESRSDWDIYKGIAKRFSELAAPHLGKETDVVTVPILHDTPAEIAQPFDVQEWRKGECEPIPARPCRTSWRWSGITRMSTPASRHWGR
jgi:nitrate reductase / nitrite oxidoreductase, alpha subunit